MVEVYLCSCSEKLYLDDVDKEFAEKWVKSHEDAKHEVKKVKW